MFSIDYQTGCRNCNTTHGISTSMIIIGEEASDWIKKTEFEVMLEVEEFRKENDFKCMFCNSSNVEVSNIEIQGQPLFDFVNLVEKAQTNNNLDIIVLSITKVNNVINYEIGGRQDHRFGFLVESINKVIKYISDIESSFFISHSDSSFYVCISEKMPHSVPTIEKFNCHGFSKVEILETLNKILKYIYDSTFPVDPNLNFPLIGAYNSNKIIKKIFSNAGKTINMEISYFDEDVRVLRSIIDGNITRRPKIKKILIEGTVFHDPMYGNIIKSDNNETLFLLFHNYTRTINILGCNAKKEMHVAELNIK